MIEFSDIQTIYYILPLVGFVIGLFGTMLGGGGGFFFIPLLTLLLGVPAQTAVITSLVATLPICIVGSWGHYRKDNVDFKVAFILISGGIIGAFVGARITNWISEGQLKVAFGVYSILIALNMMRTTYQKQHLQANKKEEADEPKATRIAKGSFFGLAAGMITGTFGTSGTAPIIAGLFSLKVPFKTVVGTSLVVVLVNTLFATGAHFVMGRIDLTLVGFLAIGSTIGALLGPKLLTKVATKKTEGRAGYWYAVVMIIIGILMIIGRK